MLHELGRGRGDGIRLRRSVGRRIWIRARLDPGRTRGIDRCVAQLDQSFLGRGVTLGLAILVIHSSLDFRPRLMSERRRLPSNRWRCERSLMNEKKVIGPQFCEQSIKASLFDSNN